ncbi:MAG: hypothetical protein H6849_03545 [Alphaproteobacteria bacterium]|nr:MAG: hypothetical protein H6849_03545 [Alphaproteobacteria bacterium]
MNASSSQPTDLRSLCFKRMLDLDHATEKKISVHIYAYWWMLFLFMFTHVCAVGPSDDIIIYITPHIAGKSGLASYYAKTLKDQKKNPVFCKKYPSLTQGKVRFVTVAHVGHLWRILGSHDYPGPKPSVIMGLLDYEADALRFHGRAQGKSQVFAESPLTLMVNRAVAKIPNGFLMLSRGFVEQKSLLRMCRLRHTILMPHTIGSAQGRDMMVVLAHVCGQHNLNLQHASSWSSAYVSFLYGHAPFVVSYAGSSLFHAQSTHYPPTQFIPMVMDEGHLIHRYVAMEVTPSRGSAEFLDFIQDDQHTQAIQRVFRMYPPGGSPAHFLENRHLHQHVVREYMRRFDRPHFINHVTNLGLTTTVTAVFSILIGVLSVICGLVLGWLGAFTPLKVQTIVRACVGGSVFVPHVILIPLVQRAWPHVNGWLWAGIFELWIGVGFVSVMVLGANQKLPESLIVQARQVRLAPIRFFWAVYVPCMWESYRGYFVTIPFILFGVCGVFLFTEPQIIPQAIPSINTYVLMHAHEGASWVSNPLVWVPHIIIAGTALLGGIARTPIPADTWSLSNNGVSMPWRYWPMVVFLGVMLLYGGPILFPVIRFFMVGEGAAPYVQQALEWKISSDFLISGAYSLGVAMSAALIGAAVFVSASVLFFVRPYGVNVMVFCAILGFIAPRFVLIGANYPHVSFILAQGILGFSAATWFLHGILQSMQKKYLPLVRLHRLSLQDIWRGVIKTEVLPHVWALYPLFCLIVMNEFVTAQALSFATLMPLPTMITAALGHYRYLEAFPAVALLMFMNGLCVGAYVWLSQRKEIL